MDQRAESKTGTPPIRRRSLAAVSSFEAIRTEKEPQDGSETMGREVEMDEWCIDTSLAGLNLQEPCGFLHVGVEHDLGETGEGG